MNIRKQGIILKDLHLDPMLFFLLIIFQKSFDLFDQNQEYATIDAVHIVIKTNFLPYIAINGAWKVGHVKLPNICIWLCVIYSITPKAGT